MWIKRLCDRLAKRLGYVPTNPGSSDVEVIDKQLQTLRRHAKACELSGEMSDAVKKLDNANNALRRSMTKWSEASASSG